VQEIERPGATAGAPGEGHPYLVALQSLGDLADDILAMAGASRPVTERLALRPLLATAVLLARRSRASARVDVTGECASVLAPRGPLVHALFNLLDNACRVTRPGHPVRVRLARLPDRVCIEIEDGETGCPPRCRPRAVAVESAHGAAGLMAARRFLEACGGSSRSPRAGRGHALSRAAARGAAATTPPARAARASAGN
jgi:K+-sensing histidine kinase KdpD